MKKVVVIGGGSGTYTILSGLKNYRVDISAIVTMMDSGGSSGELRDQLGVLPPGDLRQCLVALSSAENLWRRLFLYRFERGSLRGHNFGNILITALEKITGDYNEVVGASSNILSTVGKVIPVTFDTSHLCVEFEDGKIVRTEDKIDKSGYTKSRIRHAYLVPEARANPLALQAIDEADYIIFGPGDLYTSIIPNLVVEGISASILKSRAKILFVVNLMTKSGQTTNYKASDHIKDLEIYTKRKISTVFMNMTAVSGEALSYYEQHGEKQVVDDIDSSYAVVRKDLISESLYVKSKADKTFRSLVRHDSSKVAGAIWGHISSGNGIKEDIKDVLSEARSVIFG